MAENTVEMIPDMRGIVETAKRFGLPVHMVRRLVKEGKVKSVQAGSKKFYVNQASLIDYLNCKTDEQG